MMHLWLVMISVLFTTGCAEEKIILEQHHMGIGSGAFHLSTDPENIIYTLRDKNSTIFKIEISTNTYKVLQTIPIIQNNDIDAEAIVKLRDGTFWIADETLPSLIHIDNNGNILKRIVPKNTTTTSTYRIIYSLPTQLSNRRKNKGFESLAVSDNEKFLFFALQAPIHKKSSIIKIYRYDIETENTHQIYTYTLDKKKNYISEMVMIKNNQLIVIEKEKKNYKFYNISSGKKKLRFTYGKLKKIEAVAYMGKNNWTLLNDNDLEENNTQGVILKLNNF